MGKTSCAVVKVSITAVVADIVLDVSEFTISNGINAIPRIELMCAPQIGGTSDFLKPHVSAPTIEEYTEVYRDLANKAEGLDITGYVYIRVTEEYANTAQTVDDEITLNEWVLSDVGMSTVSATAAPYLSVVLQHPICRLTKVGSVYETPCVDLRKYLKTAKMGEKFLDIVEGVYEAVQPDDLWYKPPTDAPRIWRHELVKPQHLPKTYLDDETSVFLVSGGGAQRMIEAEQTLALPMSDGSSTWDMLLKASGDLLLNIVQDDGRNYTTDKLILQPTEPWKGVSIHLDQEWCASTDLFGRDPFKIAGVMARKLGPGSCPITLGIFYNGNLNETDQTSDVMYAPSPYDENPTIADGRILKTSAPSMLDMMFREDAEFGSDIANSKIEAVADRQDDYNEALKKYCKAVFDITAAKMSMATANMTLHFHDNAGSGALIVPGETACFWGSRKDLYYGCISKVVHHGAVKGGCYTTIQMSHVRPEPDYKAHGGEIVIPIGTKNAAYEK